MSGIILDQDGHQIAGEARQRQVAIIDRPAAGVSPYAQTIAKIGDMVANPDFKPEEITARLAIFERMIALDAEWQQREKVNAYHEAMAAAKAEIAPIKRNKQVKFGSNKEGAAKTNYWHEDLAEIARVCIPVLAKHGLHYDFIIKMDGGKISVQCVLHHRLGHEVVGEPLSGAADKTGNKNDLQAIESTATYLKRSAVKAALGLAVGDIDDDGLGAGDHAAKDEPKITADQVTNIEQLIANLPNSHVTRDTNALLKLFEIESFDQLPVALYSDCLGRLDAAKTKREEVAAAAAREEKEKSEDAERLKQTATEAARTTTSTGQGRMI